MLKLHVIIASTRPGRVGPTIGKWFFDSARRHGGFEVELVDLADQSLPLLDEPNHPRLRKYTHQHTTDWSTKVDSADAFVFVTPEYNYSSPPSLMNALDYLFHEWSYKPVGFVSYGGPVGGTRSVQMTKQLVTSLKMMPLQEGVAIAVFSQYIDKDGVFVPIEAHEKSATMMLDELKRWATALKPMRGQK
jgi:NAD(P)H-dependent FMN reductase